MVFGRLIRLESSVALHICFTCDSLSLHSSVGISLPFSESVLFKSTIPRFASRKPSPIVITSSIDTAHYSLENDSWPMRNVCLWSRNPGTECFPKPLIPRASCSAWSPPDSFCSPVSTLLLCLLLPLNGWY